MSMLQLHNLLRSNMKSERPTRPLMGRTISIDEAIKMHIRRDMSAVDEVWLKLQISAVLDGRASELGPFDGVDGAWKDEPCFLLSGSKGLGNALADGLRFEALRGFHTIAVNHVVEDYPEAEWLIFLDKRLLTISPMDIMGRYKGRMFAHIKARLTPSERVTVFYTQNDGPSEHIVQGLYSFVATGLTAINLALISGARPIYLLGVDNGGLKSNVNGTHYKPHYTGERKGHGDFEKFKQRIPEMLLRYAPWSDRFVNVDPLGDITVFRKMRVRDIPELKGRI